MDRFIQQANIDHYRKLMARTADESIRQRIQRLLDEEYEKDRPLKEEEMARP
jgi:predicted component of type VI protein secretion system